MLRVGDRNSPGKEHDADPSWKGGLCKTQQNPILFPCFRKSDSLPESHAKVQLKTQHEDKLDENLVANCIQVQAENLFLTPRMSGASRHTTHYSFRDSISLIPNGPELHATANSDKPSNWKRKHLQSQLQNARTRARAGLF